MNAEIPKLCSCYDGIIMTLHYMHIVPLCYCEELCAKCTKYPGQFFNSTEQGHWIWICSKVCFKGALNLGYMECVYKYC